MNAAQRGLWQRIAQLGAAIPLTCLLGCAVSEQLVGSTPRPDGVVDPVRNANLRATTPGCERPGHGSNVCVSKINIDAVRRGDDAGIRNGRSLDARTLGRRLGLGARKQQGARCLTASVPAELAAQVREWAKERRVSVFELIASLITEHLENV